MIGLTSVRWDIAQKCNLNCRHCQTGDHRANNYYETNTEEAKIIIDKLSSEGVINMGLLGGEPLIRKDIRELVTYMHDKGMKITINTNGLFLEEDLLKFLFEKNCSLMVSLDGATEKTHEFLRGKRTFQKTIEKIRLATQVKAQMKVPNQIGLSIVLHQRNKNELEELFVLGQDLGIDILSMQAVYRTGNADKHWDFLSLSGEEIITLGLEYVSLRRKKLWSFQVDERFLTNKAIKHINNEIGYSLKYHFVGDGDGYKNAYIRCDGAMLPSAGLLGLPDKFEYNNLVKFSVVDIYLTDIYKKWRELTGQKLYKNYYEPCKTCEFSGTSCFPSPNAYMNDKVSPLELCNYINELELVGSN